MEMQKQERRKKTCIEIEKKNNVKIQRTEFPDVVIRRKKHEHKYKYSRFRAC